MTSCPYTGKNFLRFKTKTPPLTNVDETGDG
jgi:hypothetical protein